MPERMHALRNTAVHEHARSGLPICRVCPNMNELPDMYCVERVHKIATLAVLWENYASARGRNRTSIIGQIDINDELLTREIAARVTRHSHR